MSDSTNTHEVGPAVIRSTTTAINESPATSIDHHQLELALVRIIQDGTARCGSGFGKYPLGVLAAVEDLIPAVIDSPLLQDALTRFRQRLA